MSRSRYPDASKSPPLTFNQHAWEAYGEYCRQHNLFPIKGSLWWEAFLAGWYAAIEYAQTEKGVSRARN